MPSITVIKKVIEAIHIYILHIYYLETASTRRGGVELSMYTVVLHKRFNHQNFGVFIGKDVPTGFYVVTVQPHSPAADANIQPGDHVLAINGQLLSSMPENSIEMITQISNQAESLTLSLLSSDILKLTEIPSINYDNGFASPENDDLEKYYYYFFLVIRNNFFFIQLSQINIAQ